MNSWMGLVSYVTRGSFFFFFCII